MLRQGSNALRLSREHCSARWNLLQLGIAQGGNRGGAALGLLAGLSLHKATQPDLLKQLRPPCLRAILIGVLIRGHAVLSSFNGWLILGGSRVMPVADTPGS